MGNHPRLVPPCWRLFVKVCARKGSLIPQMCGCWAAGQFERLPAMAQDLVNRRVTVIAAGTPPAALAAKAATSSIPIVFTSGIDAVKLGLVARLNRPGGNVTGISFLIDELTTKQLGLLRDLLPRIGLVGLLLNPNFYNVADQFKATQNAARVIGAKLEILPCSSEKDIEAAFVRLTELRADALMVSSDPRLMESRNKIVALAEASRIPAVYSLREYVAAGGLMSYDTSITDAYHQAAVYVSRILKGAKPADLPVMQPTRFELVINLKTAKALGLTVPPGMFAIADAIIE
jgi:putative ABC transport system substrate-binding protein